MGTRRALPIALFLSLSVAVAGCTASSSGAFRQSTHAVEVPPTTPAPTSTTVPEVPCADPEASLAPDATIAPNSSMAKIQARGRLIVGVDQNTKLFGYRDPRTGKIDGLDIDMLRAVARGLFGNLSDDDIDSKIDFRSVTTAQRFDAVNSGAVDIVASLITVTCDRHAQVGLSSVYYVAHQKVLVRGDSTIATVQDLAGKTVCATAGSTSIAQIHQIAPKAILDPVSVRTDCLVALEEGTVDAITADDTILLGFQTQDPKTTLLPESLHDEPYGIAVAKDHPEFVQFVNAVLEQMRADGTLEGLYVKWLGDQAPTAPPPAKVLGNP